MSARNEAYALLSALPEAALLIRTDGAVDVANRSAVRFLGLRPEGGNLAASCPTDQAASDLRAYLVRCSGSRSPLPGAIDVRSADGQIVRIRSQASLLWPAEEGAPARLLLRLAEAGETRFAELTRKIHNLNDEIRRRRRIQAILEDAIRDRDLLMRELHHRVNNNIHVLVGLLSTARRESDDPAVISVLDEASKRLGAVGIVHRMLYSTENLHGVSGDQFVARLATSLVDTFGARERVAIHAAPIVIPNDAAVPLALILNELLTNALKHGIRLDGQMSRIRVSLAPRGDHGLELAVEDDGQGFDLASVEAGRTSGLGLVRGLTRQLGGAFMVGRSEVGGALCAVRFRPERASSPKSLTP